MSSPIVIIGTGLAGYQLAREFRCLDPVTPLFLFTADAGDFYSKPQLSVSLTRQKTPAALVTSSAESMAEQLNATVLTHTQVTDIHPARKTLVANGNEYPFEKLVLALGAVPARPPLQGNALTDVLTVNHLAAYTRFRTKILNKKHITLLGAGLIGCEFANDLVNTGHTVHVITPAATPVELLLPEKAGHCLKKTLTQQGICFHTGCTAARIDHATGEQYEIQLSNGDIFKTDTVLSATGLRPLTSLADRAGLKTQRGIGVDAFLQTTCPDIYALGDCAEVNGLVLPYVAPLLQAARALARTLTGQPTAVSYPAMPISLKTPAHPTVVCPPLPGIRGEWQIRVENSDVHGLFLDESASLRGFVLMGKYTREKQTLAGQIPPLMGPSSL